MTATTWTVGKAAQAAGLSAKAVRLYEAKGLLPAAERTGAGYRTYTDDDITVLRFIRQAKTLGLSLGEIRDIIDLRRGGTAPCQHVVALLDPRTHPVTSPWPPPPRRPDSSRAPAPGRRNRRPATVTEAIEAFPASPRCNEPANTPRQRRR